MQWIFGLEAPLNGVDLYHLAHSAGGHARHTRQMRYAASGNWGR